MALLRNREVTILGRTDGEDASPTFTVLYPDNNRENVKLSQLQLTEKEAEDMKKAYGESSLVNVTTIKDKDLQELRDSNDKAKIEAKQEKKSPDPVAVTRVMVDPKEVDQRSVVKTDKKAK